MAVKYRIRELDVYVWSERYANAIYPPSSRIEIEIWSTADGDVVKVDAKSKDEKKNVFDIREQLLKERYMNLIVYKYFMSLNL